MFLSSNLKNIFPDHGGNNKKTAVGEIALNILMAGPILQNEIESSACFCLHAVMRCTKQHLVDAPLENAGRLFILVNIGRHSIKRRIHRIGRNDKGLNEKASNAQNYNRSNQQHFDIFYPVFLVIIVPARFS